MRHRVADFGMGVLIGALGGFVVGLLYAPSTGAVTRKRLAVGAHRAAGVARDVAERAERVAEGVGHHVDHYLGRDEEVAWRKVREIREGLQGYTPMQG